MRNHKIREERDDKISDEFKILQTEGHSVEEACEKLGKQYYLAPSTIYDIVYKTAEQRSHGRRNIDKESKDIIIAEKED